MRNLFGLFILILLLGGCTEKGRSIHKHEQYAAQAAPGTAQVPEQSAIINGQTLKQLAERVLDPKRIRDPKSLASRAVRDELLAFNSMLLKNPDREILQRYSQALALDCGDFRASCVGLNYFRQAASSSLVAKLGAQISKNEIESNRLILSAYSIQNAEYDPELLALLLERSDSIFKNASPRMQEAVEDLLNSAIITANSKTQDREELRRMLKRIQIWNLIQSPAWNLSESANSALWTMAAKGKALNEAGSEDFVIKLSEHPASVIYAQKQLRPQNMFTPSALSAEYIEKLEGINLIIDAVFTGRISADNAALVAINAGHSPVALANAVENYFRLRFALTTHEANLAMAKVLKAKVTTEQLYAFARGQSTQIKKYWSDLRTRLSQVRVFATIALKNSRSTKLEEKIATQFETFAHQVNLTSVYPQMMGLFYTLSKKEFFVELAYNGKMNTATILTYLYFGSIKPQFEYSEAQHPLNHFEIMYAFDLAVRTGLFQTFGIDVDDFIANSLSRLTEVAANKVHQHLDGMANHYQEAASYRDLKNACAEFSPSGWKAPRQIDLSDLNRSPYYGILMNDISKAVTDPLRERNLRGLFFGDNTFAEIVELTRLDIPQHIRTANTMIASYESYLTKFAKLNADQIPMMTKNTRAVIKRLNGYRERMLKDAAKYESEQGRCVVQMNRRDLDIEIKIMEMEAQHLRQVHRDIVNLRAGRPMEFSHDFQGLPGDYKGSEIIDKGGYTVNKLDLFIRIGKRIEQMEPQITVNYGDNFGIDRWEIRLAHTKSRRIQFVEDQEQFVNAGLRSYFPVADTWLSWNHGGGRLTMWPFYVKALASLYRLEREYSGKNVLMTPERIIEAQEEFVKLTQINDGLRIFLERIGAGYYYENNELTERLINHSLSLLSQKMQLQEIFGVLDVPAFYANESRLGVNFDLKSFGLELTKAHEPRRFGYIEYAKLYYKIRSKSNRGLPLLPYSPEVDKYLDSSIRSWVQHEIASGTEFYKVLLKRAAELEALPSDQRFYADLTLTVKITDILTPSLHTNFTAALKTLDRETEGCFVRQCDDFN